MLVRVLGSAGSGGVPRWSCACSSCADVRAHKVRRRTHAAIAVSADGEAWVLVGATPDVLRQVDGFDGLHPRAAAPPPLVAVALRSLGFDEAGGLFGLQGAPLVVLAREAEVSRAADVAPPNASVRALNERAEPLVVGELDVGLTFAIAGDALVVHEPANDRLLVWAPRLAPGAELPAASDRASCMFVDARVASTLAATTAKHRYLVALGHDDPLLDGGAPPRGWTVCHDGLDLFV